MRVFSIIAEKLKGTDKGVAEFFAEASVYFSDIVGFTKLASESRPLEVVGLLNDLYSALDAVISRHNVYKVACLAVSRLCLLINTNIGLKNCLVI